MKTNRFLFTAACVAIVTLFACSSEDSTPEPQGGGEPSSNSTGEGNQQVFCKTAGTCSQISLSACMELVSAGAAQIVPNCNAEPPQQTPSSSSATPTPPGSSSASSTVCKDTQGREYFCQWGTDCWAIDPTYSETPGTCPELVNHCRQNGRLYVGGTREGENISCNGTYVGTTSTPDISCTPADNNSTHYCSNGSLKEYGRVNIGGEVYKTVVIGSQTWMAENLEGGVGGWGAFVEPLSGVSLSAADACPSGWHLPNADEWDILTDFVETDSRCGFNCAGKKLKAKSGWNNNGNGTDDYGFSALPVGYLYQTSTSYEVEVDKGNVAVWWTSSCSDALSFCDYRATISKSDDIFDFKLSPNMTFSPDNVVKYGWYSIRCVKN